MDVRRTSTSPDAPLVISRSRKIIGPMVWWHHPHASLYLSRPNMLRGDRIRPIDRSAGFEKRAVEGLLGVALQHLSELSGSRGEAALDRFEPSLVQALRAMTGLEAAKPSTRTAVEDTIVILRRTIDRASRTILRRAPVDANPRSTWFPRSIALRVPIAKHDGSALEVRSRKASVKSMRADA